MLPDNVIVVPDPEWLIEPSWRDSFKAVHLPWDCRCLLEFADGDAKQFRKLGYQNGMEFIIGCLGLDREEVETVLDVLRARPAAAGPIPYATALRRAGLKKGQRSRLGRTLKLLTTLTTAERRAVRAALDATD